MIAAYYNEIDPFAAAWLRNLIAAGLIAPGDVDERSITDVDALGTHKYTQCHFFAGIGGWSYALRLAGWPDERPVWTGSCPCQPFSLAGKQRGFDDERHLWPVWQNLIAQRRPPTIFGEQVASATEWLGLVRSDLEKMGYAVGALPIQAASAGADHLRDRYWFVAYADEPSASEERQQRGGEFGGAGGHQDPRIGRDLAQPDLGNKRGHPGDARSETGPSGSEAWPAHGNASNSPRASSFDWVIGADGKARRVKPGIRLLAHGVPARVGKLRGFGNAIDPRPAAEFIRAAMAYAP